jgi:hypothetical protein
LDIWTAQVSPAKCPFTKRLESTSDFRTLVPSIGDQEQVDVGRYTSERDNRFIVSTSLRNRRLNAVQIQRELRDIRGLAVSEWTVRRRLQETNLTPRRPATGPKLTAAHRQARLRFARKHLNWTLDHWMSLLFSDGRGRVYRRPGERFAECCIDERVSYGGGSCMIWGGISAEGRTEPVFMVGAARGRNRRSLTAARYVGEILADQWCPMLGLWAASSC